MSQPKAQLLDPQGNISLPGISATGVITATSLSGISTGSVTNLTGDPDLDVGIVTASSFIGQGSGHAANLAGTPQLNLGITSSTNFIGDAVGKAAGLTGTPNLNVGLITATSFVGFVTGNVTGNISGLAASVTPGVNLGVGVCTAIQYHGDGSTLTGAGSSAYIAQEITASGPETIIDLSDGNVIHFNQNTATTTVGFASTSPAEQLTIIRDTAAVPNNTGAVTFDGTGDYLSIASNSDFTFGTDDFTYQCWIYPVSCSQDVGIPDPRPASTNNVSCMFGFNSSLQLFVYVNGSLIISPSTATQMTASAWHHVAYCRVSGGQSRIFLDGNAVANVSDSNDYVQSPMNYGWHAFQGATFNGKLSNVQIIKGRAVYTTHLDYPVPNSPLIDTGSETKLLCCQSTTSATAATVSPGTITGNGNVAAESATPFVSKFRTAGLTWPDRIKWGGGTTPLLQNRVGGFQIFRFTTVDTGLTYNGWEESESPTGYTAWAAGTGGGKGMHGNNTAGNVSSPVQVFGGSTWRYMAAEGSMTAMGIKTDNTLWTWGNPTEGESGLNNRTKHSSPIQVGTENNWKTINRNYYGWLGLKSDGSMWNWGDNSSGQLGLNDQNDRSSPTQVPGRTDSDPEVWTYAVGGRNRGVLATKSNGSLWSWGNNEYGPLGQNNTTAYSSPKQVGSGSNADESWATGRNKIAIEYSLAGGIKANGTLWMWGGGGNGSIGNNDRTTHSSPVQVGTDANWSQLSVLSGSPMGIKDDNTLWVWGANGQGVLGLNEANPAYRSSPTQLPGTNWSDFGVFGVGSGGAACLKTDGTWWSWGYQMWGEFGINQGNTSTSGAFSSPVQLPGTYADFCTDSYNSFWLKA